MSGGEPLYEIDIQTAASPEEVFTFARHLEAAGYGVVTDLSRGKLRIEERGGSR